MKPDAIGVMVGEVAVLFTQRAPRPRACACVRWKGAIFTHDGACRRCCAGVLLS